MQNQSVRLPVGVVLCDPHGESVALGVSIVGHK